MQMFLEEELRLREERKRQRLNSQDQVQQLVDDEENGDYCIDIPETTEINEEDDEYGNGDEVVPEFDKVSYDVI